VTAAAVTGSLMFGQAPPPVTQPTVPPGASTAPAPPTTAELIEAWARDLESGPPPPPVVAGQTITVTERRFSEGVWSVEPGLAIEREGLIIIIDSPANDGRASVQSFIEEQRAEFAEVGPSWRYPTAEWLEALGPSPANLISLMQGPLVFTPSQVIDAIQELLSKGEIILPPRVRAGLLRLLGTLDGVEAYEATVDGHRLRVVAVPLRSQVGPATTVTYGSHEMFIDPNAHRFVGSAWLRTARAPELPQCVTTGNANDPPPPRPTGDECFEVIPLAEPEREMITLWEQALVSS
jgi:hypothetical protein